MKILRWTLSLLVISHGASAGSRLKTLFPNFETIPLSKMTQAGRKEYEKFVYGSAYNHHNSDKNVASAGYDTSMAIFGYAPDRTLVHTFSVDRNGKVTRSAYEVPSRGSSAYSYDNEIFFTYKEEVALYAKEKPAIPSIGIRQVFHPPVGQLSVERHFSVAEINGRKLRLQNQEIVKVESSLLEIRTNRVAPNEIDIWIGRPGNYSKGTLQYPDDFVILDFKASPSGDRMTVRTLEGEKVIEREIAFYDLKPRRGENDGKDELHPKFFQKGEVRVERLRSGLKEFLAEVKVIPGRTTVEASSSVRGMGVTEGAQ